MNTFTSRILMLAITILCAASIAQDRKKTKYKTLTSCRFGDTFKIEVHQFPDIGPRSVKQHVIAYIKHPRTKKWKRTRIYLPKAPIIVKNKQRDLTNLREPASKTMNLEVLYFKDDLQKPVKSTYPSIDDNAGILGILQQNTNSPVSMVLKGYFHHFGWGPTGFNEIWSTYDKKHTKRKSILLQKTFYDMAYTKDCQREYIEI